MCNLQRISDAGSRVLYCGASKRLFDAAVMLPHREFTTLLIASLLRDLIHWLPDERFRALPLQELARAVDVDLLTGLLPRPGTAARAAPGAEEPHPLARLLARASRLAQGQPADASDQGLGDRTEPLASIFDSLFAGADQEPKHRIPALRLAAPGQLTEAIFPAAWSPDSFSGAEELAADLGQLLVRPARDAETLVAWLLTFLQRHASTLPAPVGLGPTGTALFDHLQVTAALVACLYLMREESDTLAGAPEFCLLTGDFSGIQHYIFDIASGDGPGRGTARRLRARSFVIQALAEAVPRTFLREAGLSPANLVLASGGKFSLVVPNHPALLDRLRGLAERWSAWFLDTHRGALTLNLVWTPFGEADLIVGPDRGFSRITATAAARLADVKAQPLAGYLTGPAGWHEDAFRLAALPGAPCTSCQKFATGDAGLCAQCEADLDWGRRLPAASGLAFFPPERGHSRSLGLLSADLLMENRAAGDAEFVIGINDPDRALASVAPTTFRYLVSHVPVQPSGELLTFEDIAQAAAGRPLLGFLKLDVDKLGETFAFGLRGGDSLARVSTLSRRLDFFFTGWVQHLLETEFPACYAVFSGGDDVFVVGPWDGALTLALRLADDFARYTGQNPHLSISGGLLLGAAHYPIGQAARAVDVLEERSKAAGGGRLTLLGQTVTWESLRRVWPIREELRRDLASVSQGFLHDLISYAEMWRRRDFRLQPLLAYSLAREPTTPAFAGWFEQFIGIRPLGAEQRFLLDHLGLIARLLILARGGSA